MPGKAGALSGRVGAGSDSLDADASRRILKADPQYSQTAWVSAISDRIGAPQLGHLKIEWLIIPPC